MHGRRMKRAGVSEKIFIFMTLSDLILVPETPIKDSKLKRLMEVFGSSRPVAALSKALENANGELELAIMYAAVEPATEVTQISVPAMEQPLKKRKLIKKKDLPLKLSDELPLPKVVKETDVKKEEVVNVISDEDDSQDSESLQEEENTFEAATVLYFNSCADEQLVEATGCSQDDAAFISSQRPFTSFKHLRDSLASHKRRFVAILDRYVEIMIGFAKVDELIEETKAYGDDIKVFIFIFIIGCFKKMGVKSR